MSQEKNHQEKEQLETLIDILNDVDVVMLTSISEEGKLVARPMQTQELEYDGDLWFITMKHTDKYKEIEANPTVNISVVGKSYASISGTAKIVDDRERLDKHWNKIYEKMFDTHPKDPNLTMVKIEMDSAEYWDTGNRTGMIVNLFKNITNSDDKDSSDDTNQTIEMDNN